MFNSWAVIDFIAEKLDMDQIRDRVRALSSCFQQLGKFFYGCVESQILLTLIPLGMGMIIQVWSKYTLIFCFTGASVAIERDNPQHPEEVWLFLHVHLSLYF